MLALGSQAPDFNLSDQSGQPAALRSLVLQGPLVIFFYPGDFTPACSAQACIFRDMHALATAAGVQVVGINPGPRQAHALFQSTFHLPYRLLCDPGKRVTRAYDALGPLGLLPRRVTYLVSPDAIIRDRVEASLRLSRHRAFMQRVLAAASVQAAPEPAGVRPVNPPDTA